MDQRELYEKIWQNEWKSEFAEPGVSNRSRRRIFLSCVDKLIAPGATVLDVGCGNGELLRDIFSRYPNCGQLYGTDLSSSALDLARANMPHAEYFQCDPQTEDFKVPGPFDLIICSEVLEHVPEFEVVLQRISQAVKPGGGVVISVPHSMRNWGPHDEAVHHVRRFEQDQMRKSLEDVGLEVLRVFSWGALLYNAYHSLLLNKVSPQFTWKKKSRSVILAHRLLYRLLYVDDLMKGRGNGHMLFAMARKPM